MATVVEGPAQAPPEAINPEALFEIVDGRRVELPPMGIYSSRVARRIVNALSPFVEDNGLGVAEIETMFLIDPDRVLKRRPDVAFVAADRWPPGRPIPDDGDWEVIPDLVIEVVSPGDLDKDVAAKIQEYFDYGVRRVWIVRPLTRQVYAYRSPTEVSIIGPDGELGDDELIPGFRLPLGPLLRRTYGP